MMSEPETPLHAEADQQWNIDNVQELKTQDIDDLELNPDLESITDEYITNNIKGSTSWTQKRSHEDNNEGEDMFDDYDDFAPQINIDSPFSSNTELTRLHGRSQNQPVNRRRLSLSQQSKFISYCDGRLMDIQRKFVQSRGLNPENGYSGLAPLLMDMKSLVDFIWYSIDGKPNTDYLLTENPFTVSQDQYIGCKSTYFGQSAYLIRIADDLLDYSQKFEVKTLTSDQQTSTLSKLFKLLFILDNIFSRLIDGTVPGQAKMSGTDLVRLTGIAERTRLKLPWFFEKQDIHGYHYEVSKIYESTLERCSH